MTMRALSPVMATENFSLDAIESATALGLQGITGRFREWVLHSHFQPVFSLAHRRAVGYEGLVRPHSLAGAPVAPGALFQAVGSDSEMVFLDRLARNLHVRNFMAAGASEPWLFLNVNARVALCGKNYGAYFASMLARHGLPPHRVVIELVENEIPDERLLAEAMRYYTELGCLVAIDDFGAGHSNFERIWRVQPQIVKIDRTTLVQAREHKRVRRVFPNLVALLHEAGCLALIEGVETEEEAMTAMDAGVDFVQGFFFARPGRGIGQERERSPLLGGLSERQAQIATANGSRNRLELEPYLAEFRNCAGVLAISTEPGQASANMLALPRVLRCYVLDGNGNQIGSNLESPRHELRSDPRFHPVSNPESASWARRPYFRRAMADPGQIQISRPYLSITDARMCITISIRLKDLANNDRVCCVDVLWDEGERGG